MMFRYIAWQTYGSLFFKYVSYSYYLLGKKECIILTIGVLTLNEPDVETSLYPHAGMQSVYMMMMEIQLKWLKIIR